ncbi:hypothetical protein SAMN05428975_2896 [Mucilaginibacter sp. OK268]|uniref:hypothetical protein n=1 Tax=Mucilaginibacter sp. OK268 TaxID=1881048 RepID=UPI00087F85B0|nr:hypothetical protein [Mucilaginibacter sp. OK268]SDP80939.1 hypothetical protein SAMN05428975_2896 [Mucilaginibacter sp. OK268]
MKNSIKCGLAAFAIAISFTACDPASKAPANSTPVDSGKTVAVDSAKKAITDSTKATVADSAKATLPDSTKT